MTGRVTLLMLLSYTTVSRPTSSSPTRHWVSVLKEKLDNQLIEETSLMEEKLWSILQVDLSQRVIQYPRLELLSATNAAGN